MGAEHAEEHRSQTSQSNTPGAVPGMAAADNPLRPDVALGLWMSWMETNFGKAQDWTGSAKPWWQVTPDDLAGNMLAAGSRQLHEILGRDPLLRSIDQMWNANPMREVVPVDTSTHCIVNLPGLEARATAMETPRMAFAPSFPLLGVPSRSIIARSIWTWSTASIPRSAGPMASMTFCTALSVPLPP